MKPIWRVLPTILRIAIGIGLLIYLGTSGALTWSVFTNLALAWPVALGGLFLIFLTMILVSWRLCLLLRPHNLYLAFWPSLKLTLIGLFFNTCLPGATGGDIIRIYYATAGNAGRRTEVATIMVLDRLTGMFALLLWPLLLAPWFPHLLAALPMLSALLWGTAVLALTLCLGVLVCLLPGIRHSRVCTWLLQHMPFGHMAARMFDTIAAYRHHKRILALAVLLSLTVHALLIVLMLHLIAGTSSTGATWNMMLLIPFGFLANALPLTPGGLGVGEAAFTRLFALAGLTGGAEALLGGRLLMLLLGLCGLGCYLHGTARFVHGQADHSIPTNASPSSPPASLSS